MEKVKYYEAQVEVVRYPYDSDNREVCWIIIGTFNNAKDAKFASKLCIIADNSKVYITINSTGNYRVKEVSCIQNHTTGPKYESLDEFMKSHVSVKLYIDKIGSEATEKLLKEIGIETENKFKKQQDRKEFNSIIERMIRHYKYTLKIDEATGTDEKTIEEYKENIQLLEDLRDGKIELK
ncbi:MAG: hypothetical protein IJA72_02625 [Clostridia bacterium]|nr:hypothetical protein [Clostridia bacterium]